MSIETVRKIAAAFPIEHTDDSALGLAAGDDHLTTCQNHLDSAFMDLLKSGAHADFERFPF